MLVTDDEAKDLKSWIIKALEDISDADSDVLADYVLALIRADAPDPEIKANAIENLEDFLRENTAKFVDDIFRALESKTYLPGYVAPIPTGAIPSTLSASSPANLAIPNGPRNGRSNSQGSPQQQQQQQQQRQQSRKRSYNDANDGSNRSGQDSHYGGPNNDRQMKQIRRGGGRGGGNVRGGFHGPPGQNFNMQNNQQPMPGMPQLGQGALPGMPLPPGGLPFDPNDPMAAILAMQAMGIPMPLPGPGGNPVFPPRQGAQNQNRAGGGGGKTKIDARCRDYDTKGICNRGVNCPFLHDENQVIAGSPQEEYDPKNSSLIDVDMDQERRPSNGHSQTDGFRGRGRGRGRGGDRGGSAPRRNNRADFSQAGPNHDRSITTVVVEQIPEEHFSEQSVRDFFSQFGVISEVTMQAYKRLALIKYDDYHSAQAAYDSPKVIFDNRFVKVYWYNPNTVPTSANGKAHHANQPPMTKSEEPAFNREKFERDAEAAQKRLDERKALQAENEAKFAELAKAKEELGRKQAEEKRRLEEKLRAKGESLPAEMAVDSSSNGGGITSTNPATKSSSSNTDALRAQLKALEDEAKSLGLDPSSLPSPGGRGRGSRGGRGGWRGGSYRGWECFAAGGGGRGGGYDPSRGGASGARGRAGGSFPYRGTLRAGGAYNLDNRPKKVLVTAKEGGEGEGGAKGVFFNGEKDEALRQYLFSIGEFESIDPPSTPSSSSPSHPPSSSSSELVVSFKDRFTAEKFFRGTKDIPGVGNLEFSWVSSPLPPVPTGGSGGGGSTTTTTFASGGGSGGGGGGGGGVISNGAAKDADTVMGEAGGANGDVGDGLLDGSGGDYGMSGGGDGGVGDIEVDAEVDYDVAEDDQRWVA